MSNHLSLSYESAILFQVLTVRYIKIMAKLCSSIFSKIKANRYAVLFPCLLTHMLTPTSFFLQLACYNGTRKEN